MSSKKEKLFYWYNHQTQRHKELQKGEKRQAEKHEVSNQGQNIQWNKIKCMQYSEVRLLKQT